MNNLVRERFLSQKGDFYLQPGIIQKMEVVINQPLSLDELRLMLEKELVDTIPIVAPLTEDIRFEGVFDFCDWYAVHQQEFNDRQNDALRTLVQARDAINIGCNCTRPNRERGAREYFKVFWTNNFNTDIMPTLLKVSGAKKVFIGNFLIYPA